MKAHHSFTRLASSAVAASALALGLSACGPSYHYEPVNPDMFNTLQNQPAGSYKLLPLVKVTEGEDKAAPTRQQIDGSFRIIVKTGEMKNAHALNAEGKSGSMLCSTFSIVSGKLDDVGRLHAEYSHTTGGRYSRTYYAYKPIEINDNKMSMDSHATTAEGYNARLVASPHKVCAFTPAATP